MDYKNIASGVLAALLVLPYFCTASGAGLEYVNVKAEGEGSTTAQATASALSSAVAQVNGASLQSSQVSAELLETVDSEAGNTAKAQNTMAAVVSQQTKGLIREYRVVSTAQEGPVWTVHVEATIARYTKSPQSNRLRITVLPFRVKTPAQKEAAERFASELNANLTQSRKFAMLDRQFEAERQEEMAINASADTSIEEMAKLGNRLGTDYMIVGVIEDGGVTTQSTQLAGRTLSSSTARLSVSYRVIDAPTGQVKFADTWSRSGEGQSVAALAAQAAETISREIVEAIAPLAVESVDGNTLYLGQGGKSIKSGQRYRLMKMGEPIVDRYTGESLGRQETEVGVIEITDVQTKLAKARIIESRVDIAAEFRSASFVVRPIAQPAPKRPSTAAAKGAAASQPKSGLQKLKSNSEGDW